ncbi:MAG: SIMPL domain-containing protein [Burkholderiaceae bacterium]|nr:SIMPL domain-containing protein [Burkholderiaceae bacterium]
MFKKSLLALIAACACAAPMAQPMPMLASPHNVLQLSAQGAVEVQQDLLSLTLGATREGADANAVQSQLRQALDAALTEAKKTAAPGRMDLRTGNFSVYPRNGRDGRISGWQGSTELVLEGSDFGLITAAAARIQTLALVRTGFGLSRAQSERVEREAQSLAIERFKARATELARGFGFGGYTLREISVTGSEQGGGPRPRALAMEARAPADAPVPVEPGKATVLVTVSGSVQLRQ